MQIWLASQSKYRLQLLREAGYDVQAVASDVDEPPLSAFSNLDSGLIYLAQWKARAARDRGIRGLILAADTVGYAGGEVLGKPRDRSDARRMLAAISGTEHDVLTGWCVLRTRDGVSLTGVERTSVTMRSWTERELDHYLDTHEWQHKSGAYGLRLPDDPFVTRVEGSVSNVIGVPLERLAQLRSDFPDMFADPPAD